jgi:hypothetical protein
MKCKVQIIKNVKGTVKFCEQVICEHADPFSNPLIYSTFILYVTASKRPNVTDFQFGFIVDIKPYIVMFGGSFPEVKRPGREADHSPPTSAEVKKM